MNGLKRKLCCLLVIFGLCALPVMAVQQTTVLYVNGIMTTIEDVRTKDLPNLQRSWLTYSSAHGITQPVIFDFAYNTHDSFGKDMGQSIAQALGVSWNNLSTDTKLQLSVLWAYSQDMMNNRIKLPVTPDADLNKLVAKTKCNLSGGNLSSDSLTCTGGGKWTGNKVVLFGHSQGNFYANYAFEALKNDTSFQSQLGVSLPNDNVLSVVNLADPANYSADGRRKYLTVCNDPINVVPKALAQNEKTGTVAAVFCSPTGIVLSDLVVAVSAFSAYVSAIPRSSPIDQTALKTQTDKVVTEIKNILVAPHLLDNYLKDGSTQLQTVMQLLADSLPDPGCLGDANCYLKDDFRTTDYANNYSLTSSTNDLTVGGSTILQASGILQLKTAKYTLGVGAGQVTFPGQLTLRTRRVFTGSSTAVLSLNHFGGGKSTVSLKKVADDVAVLSLTLNSATNAITVFPPSSAQMPSIGGSHTVAFSKTNTQAALLLDGKIVANSPASIMDGYYLEIDSEGDNTLQVQNLSVLRTTASTTSTTGTVSMATTASMQLGCGITGVPASILAPTNAPVAVSPGQVTVSCAPPSGYTISSYSPSSTVTVVAGQNTAVTVNLTAIAPTPTGLAATSLSGDSSLVAYFPFEGNSNDSKGGHNGTATGVVYGSVNGKFGQGAGFNGSGYINVGNSSAFNVAQITVAFWLQASSLSADSVVISKWWSGQSSWVMYIDGSGATGFSKKIRFSVVTNEASPSWNNKATSNDMLTAGVWYHVVGTYDGNTVKIYLNGQLQNETTSVSGTLRTSSANLQIGAWGSSAAFPSGSKVDDLAIFSRALTAGEVGALYGGSSAAPPSPSSGTVSVTVSGYSGNISCTLNNSNITAPTTLTNQSAGNYTLSCAAPTGYTISSITPSSSQVLSGGGVTGFAVNLTTNGTSPSALTGYCTVNGNTGAVSVQEGTQVVWNLNLTGGIGTINVAWNGVSAGNTASVVLISSPGIYNVSASVSDSGSPKQQISVTCPQVTVVALSTFGVSCSYSANPLVVGQPATIYGMQVGGVAPVNFTINGAYLGANNALSITPFTMGTNTASVSATDGRGRQASGSCSAQIVAPQPALSSVMPDRNPKAFQPFNLTLYGSGFMNGTQGYVCGNTTSASSCYAVVTNYISGGQILLPNVQWNAGNVNVYIKVVNPGGLSSGFQSLYISN